jgi:hypothetical protein
MDLSEFKQSKYIPVELTPKQLLFMLLPHREVLFGGAAGGGKELSSDTPIPFWRQGVFTWGKVLDVKTSDKLVGFDGKPVDIIYKTEPSNRPYRRLTFDDGSQVECCVDHLWTVYDLSKRGEDGKRGKFQTTLSVSEIENLGLKYRTQNRFAIDLCLPVEANKTDHVEAYALGYWLGNGFCQGGQITCHLDDLNDLVGIFEADGHDLSNIHEDGNRGRFTVLGWRDVLRKHGFREFKQKKAIVFDKNCDHLDWRIWSVRDRLNLVRGLLDSDGHANVRGDYEFDNTNKSVVTLTQQILQSLGLKPSSIREKKVRPNERPIFRICGCSHTQIFRLPRKANKLNTEKNRQLRNYRRYIVSIEDIGTKQGSCFKVDAENSLFVCGDNYLLTHNSETLLAAALQHCEKPGYSAILFRRSLAEHKMANNLIKRANSWLAPYLKNKEVKWNAADFEFTFKTKNWDGSDGEPAILKFGYADQADSHLRYQGGEFHFCGWDEATHFKPEFYEYLFSRMRKKVCKIHQIKDGEPNYVEGCNWCEQAKSIPIQIRAATNPGSRSHQYFKDRFRIERDPTTGEFVGKHPDRPFIPAFIRDNPHIDQKQYLDSLKELDPVKRDQLMNGDWDASPDSLYRKEHCRYFTRRGDYVVFDGESFRPNEMRWFFSMDCAATQKEVIERGDHSVIGLWGLSPRFHLGLFDVAIFKKEIPDLVEESVKLYKRYHKLNPELFVVEMNGLGLGVIQSMKARGLPVHEIHKSKDKVKFAQKGIIKMSQGRMYLPLDNPSWKHQVEGQLFVWQGLRDEPDDIVDMVSLGAHYVDWSTFDANSLENAIPKELQEKPRQYSGISVVQDVNIDFPSYF